MPCRTLLDADGRPVGVACSRGRAASCSTPGCGRPHVALCDYPVQRPGGGSQTCDAKLCASCRRPQVGRDRDFCPPHARAAAATKEASK